jgi:hypothetical protein
MVAKIAATAAVDLDFIALFSSLKKHLVHEAPIHHQRLCFYTPENASGRPVQLRLGNSAFLRLATFCVAAWSVCG